MKTTLQWLYAVGIPYATGRLSLRFSQVTPNLYIGAQHSKRGLARLQGEGISASMSLREEFDDLEHDLAFSNHGYFPIVDNTAPSMADLETGVDFIRSVIDEDGKIYVHCGSGVGRAPTMAAAYLISEGYSLDDAVAKITKARPFVRILPDQMKRLREYEAQLQASPQATLGQA